MVITLLLTITLIMNIQIPLSVEMPSRVSVLPLLTGQRSGDEGGLWEEILCALSRISNDRWQKQPMYEDGCHQARNKNQQWEQLFSWVHQSCGSPFMEAGPRSQNFISRNSPLERCTQLKSAFPWPQYHPTQNDPNIPSPSIGIKSSDWGQVNMCGFLGQWTKYNCDNSFAFHTIFSSSNRIRIVTTSSEDCHCRPDLRSRLYSSPPGCRCCPPSSSPTTSWSWWSWCQCCLI